MSLVQHMVLLFLFYTRIVLAPSSFTFIKEEEKKAMLLRIVNYITQKLEQQIEPHIQMYAHTRIQGYLNTNNVASK